MGTARHAPTLSYWVLLAELMTQVPEVNDGIATGLRLRATAQL